jgi:hypothetical protein
MLEIERLCREAWTPTDNLIGERYIAFNYEVKENLNDLVEKLKPICEKPIREVYKQRLLSHIEYLSGSPSRRAEILLVVIGQIQEDLQLMLNECQMLRGKDDL